MRYEFHPDALAEYEDAARYYADCQDGLEFRFIAAVEHTVQQIISFITDQQVIRQILKHLGLWTRAPSRDPPNANSSPKNHEPVYEFFDDLSAFNEHADGCRGYDESCIAQN